MPKVAAQELLKSYVLFTVKLDELLLTHENKLE